MNTTQLIGELLELARLAKDWRLATITASEREGVWHPLPDGVALSNGVTVYVDAKDPSKVSTSVMFDYLAEVTHYSEKIEIPYAADKIALLTDRLPAYRKQVERAVATSFLVKHGVLS